MSSVTITWRDGSTERREDLGRASGSYSQTVKAEGEFIIITDAFEKRTYIPSSLIRTVEVDAPRRGF